MSVLLSCLTFMLNIILLISTFHQSYKIPSIRPLYYITQSKPLYKCKIPYWLILWKKFLTQYSCKSKPGSLSGNSTPHIQSAGQTVSAFLSQVHCMKQPHLGSNLSHESWVIWIMKIFWNVTIMIMVCDWPFILS